MNTQNEGRFKSNPKRSTIPTPSPKEEHERLEEGREVIVLSDLELILVAVLVLPVNADVAKHLESWRVTTGAVTGTLAPSEAGSPPAALVPQGCGITCIPMMA